MMVNPDVDGCTTKTLNHWKILRKTQKNTENQKNTKPKYKLSWGPSFAFTVACRRVQFTPLAASGRPKDSKNFNKQIVRGGKILKIYSSGKNFSGVPSKNVYLAITFYRNSINSNLILAASTPMVSRCIVCIV